MKLRSARRSSKAANTRARPSVYATISTLPLVALASLTANAQVVLDPTFSGGTVGPGEYAPGQNTDYLIREGYGQRQGPNLYHRFVQFDVPTGRSATFIEDAPGSGIQRVISHIGGTTPSMIDGVIRSTIPGADVYLFNSRGVLFGPNASLDVLGAFHASTANRIRFGSAATDFGDLGAGAPVSLSAAAPSAWGFLSEQPAEIAVTGATLSVPDGQDLSLVGGPLRIEGAGGAVALNPPSLSAPSGSLQLVSVGSAGDVAIDPRTAPDLTSFARLGEIQLSRGAKLEASGTGNQQLIVRGESLSLDDAQILAHHRGPVAHGGRAVDIDVRGAIRFGDDLASTTGSLQSYAIRTPAGPDVGDAGDVSISADSVHLTGAGTDITVGAACDTASTACANADQPTGAGGRLDFNVDTLEVRNGAQIASVNHGSGDGSPIAITTRRLSVGSDAGPLARQTALIASVSFGNFSGSPPPGASAAGGDITIDASEVVTLENTGQIFSATAQNGRGGDVTVQTARFETTRTDFSNAGLPTEIPRSQISTVTGLSGATPSLSGTGDAGNLMIQASQDVSLVHGEIQSRTFRPGPGRTGAVTVLAPNGAISMSNRGLVSVSTLQADGSPIRLEAQRIHVLDGSLVQSVAAGNGQAGDIYVRAEDILARGGRTGGTPSGFTSLPIGRSAGGTGAGGTIRIDGGTLRLEDGAAISLTSRELGSAGNLIIGGERPMDAVLLNNARIESDTQAFGSGGGSIEINANRISLENGSLISTTNRAVGGAGEITLRGRDLRVLSGSEIRTASQGLTGVGGNILVRMSEAIALDQARINTNSAGANPTNQGGNIDIAAPVLILSSSQMTANAPVGAGGNIQIVAGRFIRTPTSTIQASGANALRDGSIGILASDTNTVDAVARDPYAIEDVAERLATACDARTDSRGSLFLMPRPTQAPPGEETAAASEFQASSCGRKQ